MRLIRTRKSNGPEVEFCDTLKWPLAIEWALNIRLHNFLVGKHRYLCKELTINAKIIQYGKQNLLARNIQDFAESAKMITSTCCPSIEANIFS